MPRKTILCICFVTSYLFIAKERAEYGRCGHSCLIIETVLVCRVIGNVHNTVASVYWCVVGGEYELGVYAGSAHSC